MPTKGYYEGPLNVGSGFTCGIQTDKSLWCWGNNAYGQLGINSTTTPSKLPTQVSGGLSWYTVAAGGAFRCVATERPPRAALAAGRMANVMFATPLFPPPAQLRHHG